MTVPVPLVRTYPVGTPITREVGFLRELFYLREGEIAYSIYPTSEIVRSVDTAENIRACILWAKKHQPLVREEWRTYAQVPIT